MMKKLEKQVDVLYDKFCEFMLKETNEAKVFSAGKIMDRFNEIYASHGYSIEDKKTVQFFLQKMENDNYEIKPVEESRGSSVITCFYCANLWMNILIIKKKYILKQSNPQSKNEFLTIEDVDAIIKMKKLKPATKPNYLFKGWFYDSDFQMKVPKEDYINWDEKVYAKWAKVKAEDSKTPKVKITSSSKRLQVKIPDVSKADGYQVYISTNKNFRNVTKAIVMKTNTYTGSKVVKGKTYYVKTRAFRYDSTQARIYGNFSETIKIKAS